MELLCSLLELGVTKECEDAAIHCMVILGLLTDAGNTVLACTKRTRMLHLAYTGRKGCFTGNKRVCCICNGSFWG